MTTTNISAAEELIAELSDLLDVPDERYEAAERSYKSLGKWLERTESVFRGIPTKVYTQGSFRLGTPIRPLDGEEHYDLDVVCEFTLSKSAITQERLHSLLGKELILYAESKNMQVPTPWHRCWTLNYADSAQFHMDVLASIPDAQRQRQLREMRKISMDFVDKSIAITDNRQEEYRRFTLDWPVSNPNGYAEWFRDRMRIVFDAKRGMISMKEKRASIAEIPDYRVKTPLQAAIQILKRHRDMRFSEDPDSRPTSIVLTTLAAHSYQQEASILGALSSILSRMDQFVETRGSDFWIPNPSDVRENFADQWNEKPEKRTAFAEWLDLAREDFQSASQMNDVQEIVDALSPRIGRTLVEDAAAKRDLKKGSASPAIVRKASNKLQRLLDAPHRKPLVWPTVKSGNVWFQAQVTSPGFRSTVFMSDSAPITKHSSLRFSAATNVARPFRVFWQVVNTGIEASQARGLRGGFDEIALERGALEHQETTFYTGSHSIECFIVKDNYCVARSGPFIVNIQ